VSDLLRSGRPWLYWLPALALMLLIFVLSSQSGLRVSEDASVERPIRASAHFFTYAVLAGLLLSALARGGRPVWRHVLVAFALAVLYGASDELHQSFVPDRAGRIDDLIVDTLGALVGLAIGWTVLSLRERATGARRTTTAGSATTGSADPMDVSGD
jgi:VanZ family protein